MPPKNQNEIKNGKTNFYSTKIEHYKIKCHGCQKKIGIQSCIAHLLKCKGSEFYNITIDIATLIKINTLINNRARIICEHKGAMIDQQSNVSFTSCHWCGRTHFKEKYPAHAKKCVQNKNKNRVPNRLDHAEIEYIENNGNPSGRLYSSISRYEMYPLSTKLNRLASKIIKAAKTLRIDQSSIAVIHAVKGKVFLDQLLSNQPAIINRNGNNIYSSKYEVDQIHQELLKRFDIDNMEMAFALNRHVAGHGYFIQEQFLDYTEISTSVKALSGGTLSLKR